MQVCCWWKNGIHIFIWNLIVNQHQKLIEKIYIERNNSVNIQNIFNHFILVIALNIEKKKLWYLIIVKMFTGITAASKQYI